MAVPYSKFFSQFQAIVDSVNHDSDPVMRLSNLARLTSEVQTLLVRARNEAAYDMRCKFATKDVAEISGVDAKTLDYWVRRHRDRTGAPAVGRHQRINLGKFIDLSGR